MEFPDAMRCQTGSSLHNAVVCHFMTIRVIYDSTLADKPDTSLPINTGAETWVEPINRLALHFPS